MSRDECSYSDCTDSCANTCGTDGSGGVCQECVIAYPCNICYCVADFQGDPNSGGYADCLCATDCNQ